MKVYVRSRACMVRYIYIYIYIHTVSMYVSIIERIGKHCENVGCSCCCYIIKYPMNSLTQLLLLLLVLHLFTYVRSIQTLKRKEKKGEKNSKLSAALFAVCKINLYTKWQIIKKGTVEKKTTTRRYSLCTIMSYHSLYIFILLIVI